MDWDSEYALNSDSDSDSDSDSAFDLDSESDYSDSDSKSELDSDTDSESGSETESDSNPVYVEREKIDKRPKDGAQGRKRFFSPLKNLITSIKSLRKQSKQTELEK